MNHKEIDRGLGLLLNEPRPVADPAFADRVVAAARLDQAFRRARQRAWQRAALECAAAITVGATFFLLSQTEHGSIAGTISLFGPAMAGLVMLGLWAMVALPTSVGHRGRGAMA